MGERGGLMQKPEEAKGFLKVILIVTAIGIFAVVLGCLLFSSFLNLLTGSTFAIIPLLLGGYIVYVIIRRGFEMRRLAMEGVETVGTVTRKLKFFRRRYQIKYAYYDPFGNRYYRTSFVSHETYNHLEVGSPVKVVYLPHQPSVSGLLSDVEDARRALERKT
jgi:hypothetical protein